MKVLICGSRGWNERERIEVFLKMLQQVRVEFDDSTGYCDAEHPVTVIHGAATGADRIAGEVAQSLGMEVREFPADWKALGKAAGPIRNVSMLNEEPDFVVAFHITPITPGTADMIMKARQRQIPVLLIPLV